MILRRFDLNDIEKCRTVADVFKVMGIGLTKKDGCDLLINNEEVFGGRAYYKNLVMHPNTSKMILKHLRAVKRSDDEAVNSKASFIIANDWINCSPLTRGDRYDFVNDAVGISEDVLYIITPQDSLYEKFTVGA